MSGLEGVIAAETELSLVDGDQGRLILRGHHLDEVQDWSCEQIVELLWGRPPVALGEARVRVARRLRPLLPHGASLRPMEWLRFAVDASGESTPEELMATLALALVLRSQPQAVPDPSLSHAHDLSRMLAPDAAPCHARALGRYLVCVAEHGLNASTFTARVVASTRAGAQAAVAAALAALQGPLHGGAPGPVLDMLDALRAAADPEQWLRQKLAAGERLMGFGHRIYRVRDPRADFLARACRELPGLEADLAFSKTMEELATRVLSEFKPGRSLQTNVEYYTALLLHALGFQRDEFTAVFACGRVVGWLGHIFEQEATGRLIRPESRYKGPQPVSR